MVPLVIPISIYIYIYISNWLYRIDQLSDPVSPGKPVYGPASHTACSIMHMGGLWSVCHLVPSPKYIISVISSITGLSRSAAAPTSFLQKKNSENAKK